jgi:Spy/CpxP family protein refolding chaperone
MPGTGWIRRAASLVAAVGLCATLAVGPMGPADAGPGQKGAGKGKMAGRPMGKRLMAALEKLDLSDAQKQRLRSLEARYREEIRQLKSSTADRETKRSRMKALRSKIRAEALAVLTPAQRGELKAELARSRAARRAAKSRAES